jgi:protein-L-isoaspartate(D-aspartate) O-methyltransferase
MTDSQKEDKFAEVRKRMLEYDLIGRGITEPHILKVMSEIRREEFVPTACQSQAYADGPLPIGLGQTISQPYIVALMTQELKVTPACNVLEIGTGSGYQTAVLSRLAKKVYTIERLSELSQTARSVLDKLGITNVEFYVGDGSCGWPEKIQFDRIMITATVPAMPRPLLDQLKHSGLIVAPIGSGWVQELVVWEKKKDDFIKRNICEVRFVKLFGKYAFNETID